MSAALQQAARPQHQPISTGIKAPASTHFNRQQGPGINSLGMCSEGSSIRHARASHMRYDIEAMLVSCIVVYDDDFMLRWSN